MIRGNREPEQSRVPSKLAIEYNHYKIQFCTNRRILIPNTITNV